MSGIRTTEPHSPSRSSRRLAIWITAGVLVLLVVVLAMVTAGLLAPRSSTPGAEPSSDPSGVSTPSESPSTGPSSTPSPSVDPDFGVPVAQTVPKDKAADFGDRVTARLTAITAVTATGTLPGEVSGPAVQVDLEITNGTSAEISLDTVTVNAYYGAEKTPASPYAQSSGETFPATLAAGASASARYRFSVPKDDQGSVVITVGRSAGEPIVVFH